MESGIDFRMSCLPTEKGDTFKANLYDHGCGVAVADYDGDGHDDVLFLNQFGGNALYRNTGVGTFENVTQQAGLVGLKDRICVGAAFGDFDNDDDQDLYITSTRGGNVLFENVGQGRFRDVTESAGLTCVAHSQGPAFFDYDNDGDLDLLVANSGRWTLPDLDPSGNYYPGTSDLWSSVFARENREFNHLYGNDGQGKFSDVTAETGLAGVGWCGDLAIFDYDEDGYLDVLVTNMFGGSQLYHNELGKRFENMTAETLGRTSMGAIGSKAFDFNNDGRLDLFIADMHSDMWYPSLTPDEVQPTSKFKYLLGPKVEDDPQLREQDSRQMTRMRIDRDSVVFGNTLFRNEGQGRFTEVSDAAGLETFWPWGVATGDYDNNGYEDLFLPSGMGYPYFYWPSCLMLNNGDETFTDRAADEGIEPPIEGLYLPQKIKGDSWARSSRCAATADFDGDGRLDLMVNNFNDRPYYFRNQFRRRHYIAFRLRGTWSNHDAVGTVVKLSVGSQTMIRQVHTSGGYLSQSTKTLHFGLGDQEQVDQAEVRWPSGRRQVIERPAVDQLHVVVEADGE